MKKICFWTPYIGNVGTIKATIHSAEAIKKYSDADIAIDLFKIHSEWEGYEQSIEKAELNVVDFNLKKYFRNLPKYGIFSRVTMILIMFYSIPKLISYFNKKKPEVIFSYLQGITPILARIFAKHKPKIIVSIQGLPSFFANKEIYDAYPLWKKVEAKLRIIIWKKLYLKADKILTLTESTQRQMINLLISDSDKILYIPNPIVDEVIMNKSMEEIEDKLFLDNEYILGIGRLTPQKDFRTLINAFKIIVETNKDLKLIILGEGEQKDELQSLINSSKLENNVILYGFVSNPYKYLKNAKLFILSSLWEDQGHTLVEATYLKVSVVSTKSPSGQEELLSYGKAGYLCDVSNEKDMANKMAEALVKSNSEKIDLAYQNSLKFTDKVFYENLKSVM